MTKLVKYKARLRKRVKTDYYYLDNYLVISAKPFMMDSTYKLIKDEENLLVITSYYTIRRKDKPLYTKADNLLPFKGGYYLIMALYNKLLRYIYEIPNEKLTYVNHSRIYNPQGIKEFMAEITKPSLYVKDLIEALIPNTCLDNWSYDQMKNTAIMELGPFEILQFDIHVYETMTSLPETNIPCHYFTLTLYLLDITTSDSIFYVPLTFREYVITQKDLTFLKSFDERLQRNAEEKSIMNKGLPYFFEIADEIDVFKKEHNIPESQRLTKEQLKIVDTRYLKQQKAFIAQYDKKEK